MSSILVDTSCFIAFLRGEDKATLPPLILAGRVVLSPVVKLELLGGVRKSESSLLMELLEGLTSPVDFPPVDECLKVLTRARGRGLLGGLPDIMILADCIRTGSSLLTLDKKLEALAKELKVRVYNGSV